MKTAFESQETLTRPLRSVATACRNRRHFKLAITTQFQVMNFDFLGLTPAKELWN
jgi:hypothetical protein